MPFFSGLELDHFSDRLHVIEPGILLQLSFERRSANKITIVDLYCFSLAKPIGSLLITAHLPLLLMYTSSWSSVSIVTRASNRSRKASLGIILIQSGEGSRTLPLTLPLTHPPAGSREIERLGSTLKAASFGRYTVIRYSVVMDTVGSSANAAVPHRRARAPQGCKAANSSIGVHRILPESCIAGFRSAFAHAPAVLMLLLWHFKRDVAVAMSARGGTSAFRGEGGKVWNRRKGVRNGQHRGCGSPPEAFISRLLSAVVCLKGLCRCVPRAA